MNDLAPPVQRRFWQQIGAQLRHPSGKLGRVIGHAMSIANARANALSVAALHLKPGDRLLELGCGPGLALRRALAVRGLAPAIGVDQSELMLAQAAAHNRMACADGRLILIRGDVDRLPLGDATADAILAVNVAYFFDGPQSLRETRRVLAPGGRLVLYVTDRSAMRHWPFAGPHSHRLFDAHELSDLMISAGFAADQLQIQQVDAGFGVKGLICSAVRTEG